MLAPVSIVSHVIMDCTPDRISPANSWHDHLPHFVARPHGNPGE